MEYQIDFEPVGRRGVGQADQSLLEAARQLGVDLLSLCGGIGACESCKVQLLAGQVSEPTLAEEEILTPDELEAGYRLACLTYPRSDCKVQVPPESLSTPMRTQVEGLEFEAVVEPTLRSVNVQLQPPSLSHPQADAESLLGLLNQSTDLIADTVDLALLRELSTNLRDWNWRGQAHLRDREVIAFTPAQTPPLGLAVDLGSTGIAGYLVDLQSGQTLAAKGMMNPQISYGEDIVSRCTYAMKSTEAARRMQSLVVEGLNELATELCAEVGTAPQQILEAVIVGNTAMHHLLLGLPVRQLVAAPFVPAVVSSLELKAREIGLGIAPGAYLHLLPNIAGFVGADHVAMQLAWAADWSDQTVLALDIGTNTEISLLRPAGAISTLSCASGPAFEGYHIKDGTRAKPGAIERIQLSDGEIQYKTIEDAPPAGICGSGILDAVAQLHLAGMLAENGRMQLEGHPRVRQQGDQREFVLVEADQQTERKEIIVTQADIREIQLAKSAIQTGIQVLVAESGLSLEAVDKVIIAGAFGSYIDVANAMAIGMLPALPLDRFTQVGNAAGAGAKLALLSRSKRAEAELLHGRVNYLELAKYPRFGYIFAQNCKLKPYSTLK
jgi:uncharacterized 2Fe-2S/4Fe-4S cluster protein (DUF4445 family)